MGIQNVRDASYIHSHNLREEDRDEWFSSETYLQNKEAKKEKAMCYPGNSACCTRAVWTGRTGPLELDERDSRSPEQV